MKILLLILMTIPTLAFANTHDQFDHANYFQATTISYKSLCPKDQGFLCVVDGTIITLTYAVSCSQEMTSFNYRLFEGPNGEMDVVVEAKKKYQIVTFDKPVCLGFEVVEKQITIINTVSDNLPVHQIGDKKFEGLELEDINFFYIQ